MDIINQFLDSDRQSRAQNESSGLEEGEKSDVSGSLTEGSV